MVYPSSKAARLSASGIIACVKGLFRAAVTRFTANIEGNIFVLDHMSTHDI